MGKLMINGKKKAVFNWSGGKDSALALLKILASDEYEVLALLTTINHNTQRSSMHAIPLSLLQAQAKSIGIPLYIVELASDGEMSGYNNAMCKAAEYFKNQGVHYFIFGDIFLHDVRQYRQAQLNPYNIEVIEPLWGLSTLEVMNEFLASGLQTVIVTTMANLLGCEYIGRIINQQLINDLPKNVDVCGENGEYHTFCFNGVIFNNPIVYHLNEPTQVTHTINMDDGTKQTFTYWYANLNNLPQQ